MPPSQIIDAGAYWRRLTVKNIETLSVARVIQNVVSERTITYRVDFSHFTWKKLKLLISLLISDGSWE